MAYSERFDNEILVWASLTAEIGADFRNELQRGLVHRLSESAKNPNDSVEEVEGFGGYAIHGHLLEDENCDLKSREREGE